jgi:tRNA-modifying protein YgfZ
MTLPETCPDRAVCLLSGPDALSFLQGIVSNDVLPLARGDGLVWTALLTPQGKYLADFFIGRLGDVLFLDLPAKLAASVLQRLSLYRLRADVRWDAADWPVGRGLGAAPPGALADPRHPGLGWRSYGIPTAPGSTDWLGLRVSLLVPETGAELIPNESYLLETGFERLHGVDFRKGCYVGQEVTARMKHKTELRKGLALVRLSGPAEPGTLILAEGKEAGTLTSRAGDLGIAYLRFDRSAERMQAGTAEVIWEAAGPTAPV